MSPVHRDFGHLLERIRRRLYPETVQALAFYWLKTVYARGYSRGDWKALDSLLAQQSHPAMANIRGWMREAGVLTADIAAGAAPVLPDGSRDAPAAGNLASYAVRLLNEWLPVEVARLLICESEQTGVEDGGIPAIACARAIERILVRERLTAATLEALLGPDLLPARFVYPADAELLRDVALFLLGRTEPPTPPQVLPADLVYVAPSAPLPPDYAQAVAGTKLVRSLTGDELHVPIATDHAIRILTEEQVRITSVLVSMDGRWWQAGGLDRGKQNEIVYRSMGRLPIDYSGEHARIRLPWPERRREWTGPVSFAATVEIFGRRWRFTQWEEDADHTWLHLVFDSFLPVEQVAPHAETRLRRSHPASIDMAWAALENALAAALDEKSPEPVEKLRREELIPLGRAMLALVESALNSRKRKPEEIEARLRTIRYLEAELASTYGQAPWRVLPEQVRKILLSGRLHRAIGASLQDAFAGLPSAAKAA